MIKVNTMKRGLKEGRKYLGTFVKMTDASVVELLKYSGFDCVIIDNEHSQMGKDGMVNLVRTADLCGITPIVRVRENSRSMILQALDAGAYGVMVPETSTAEEVSLVVSRTKYAPLGDRGYTASQRASGYGNMDAAEYAAFANDNTMTIVYCETKQAIDNLDKMLRVPHLDMMWIGPMDLTQALGVIGKPKDPIIQEAMTMIIRKSKEAGVPVGTIASNVADAAELYDQGVQLISIASDQAMIQFAAKQFARELGSALGR
jgi:4-hydroxy-2-oxoheptanedioate aldolase